MRCRFELNGLTPLIIHADDVEKADELKAYRQDPKNKKSSVNGDDRYPAWTWQSYLYTDGKDLVLPSEVVSAALRKAGAQLTLKGKSTFKSLTQSGMAFTDEYCELAGSEGVVSMADVLAIRDLPFKEQAAKAEELGIKLYVKRLPVGQAKTVRVRPRFDVWRVRGEVETFDDAITHDVLLQLFDLAGRLSGLGDYRPSSPKCPGPYGTFETKLAAVKGK